MRAFFIHLLTSVATTAFAVDTNGEPIWTLKSIAGRDGSTESAGALQEMELGWDELMHHVDGVDRLHQGRVKTVLDIEVPGIGQISCQIGPSLVMHQNLGLKFPHLGSYEGTCTEGMSFSMNLNKQEPLSMTATIMDIVGNTFYVGIAEDTPHWRNKMSGNVKSTSYVIYNVRESAKVVAEDMYTKENSTFQCKTKDQKIQHKHSKEIAKVQSVNTTSSVNTTHAVKYRLAVPTSPSFAKTYGSTEAALLAVISVVSRINGIYMREVGVYFELIERQDELICPPSNDTLCDLLPQSSRLLENNATKLFIENKGILWEEYDLAHFLLIVPSLFLGYASMFSVCSENKAEGMSISRFKINDAFIIAYIAHEMGHQLGASHVYKDCTGRPTNGESVLDPNFMIEGSVEPGSGSTILSYAGICDVTRNLQQYTDPYFSGKNLEEIQNLVWSQSQNGCGVMSDLGKPRPRLETSGFCVVPAGSPFQLRGNVVGKSSIATTAISEHFGITAEQGVPDMVFSWERMDTGYESYTDQSIARFRSWKPVRSSSRYFPNLAYVVQDRTQETDAKLRFRFDEAVPQEEQEMKFRFTGRQIHSIQDNSNNSQVGDFGFAETVVKFQTSFRPLQWRKLPINTDGLLPTNEYVILDWDNGQTDAIAQTLNIRYALNPYADGNFDPEKDLFDLVWKEVATVPNFGRASLWIPAVHAEEPAEVLFMIRSTNDDCYFFDITKGQLKPGPLGVTPDTDSYNPPAPVLNTEGIIAVVFGSIAFILLILALSVFVAPIRRRVPIVDRLSRRFPQTREFSIRIPRAFSSRFTSPTKTVSPFSSKEDPGNFVGSPIEYLQATNTLYSSSSVNHHPRFGTASSNPQFGGSGTGRSQNSPQFM